MIHTFTFVKKNIREKTTLTFKRYFRGWQYSMQNYGFHLVSMILMMIKNFPLPLSHFFDYSFYISYLLA